MKKPIFTKLLQIGFVVSNAEETARKYAEKYGIGPWDFYGPGMLSNSFLRGKPIDCDIKVACGYIGDIEFEFIEPIDDKSIYSEFLKEHGEGLHHLAFETANTHKETIEFFAKNNIDVLMDSYFGGEEEVTYVSSEKDLACIAEFYNRPENVTYPTPTKIINVPKK